MNRRPARPTHDEVHNAITAITQATGKPPAHFLWPNTSASQIPHSDANSPT